jgi:Ni2+-binding GTPase involved in maturation of urease and hydrogenase
MFRGTAAMVFNESDLLPYASFRMNYFQKGIEELNLGVVEFQLSYWAGEGLDAWRGWLDSQVKQK